MRRELVELATQAMLGLTDEERDEVWIALHPVEHESTEAEPKSKYDDPAWTWTGIPNCWGATIYGPDGCTCIGRQCERWTKKDADTGKDRHMG